MKRFTILSVVLAAFVLVLSACDDEGGMMNPSEPGMTAQSPAGGLIKTGRTQIWADGQLFDSIVTPASFKPGHGPFDILFNGNFKDGIGHISDAKPGDKDYNGGRWAVYNLKSGVNPNKYSDADSDDELDMNDFESAGVYFECPLLLRK